MSRKIFGLLLAALLLLGTMPSMAHGATGVPFTLETPQNLTAELKYDNEGMPYFELKLDIPQSVKVIDQNLNQDTQYYSGTDCYPVEINFDYKYGDYDWNKAPSLYWNNSMGVAEYLDHGVYDYRPFDEGGFDSTLIKAETYQFRASFNVLWGYKDDWIDKNITSDYSNIVTIGNPAYSNRLSGTNRIGTAIAIAKEGWPNGSDTVILTRDDNYPDALTGAPLSKKLDAPILFTNSKVLSADTEKEIVRLQANKVIILGGTGAVSQAIEDQLKQTYQVQRIGGVNRYETAANIAKELGFKGKAVIATGNDFHDALTVSPVAAYSGIPILLTVSASLPSFTKDALNYVAPTEVIVVGNTSMVSDSVLAELTNPRRITGSDIFQSAVAVAKDFNADTSRIFLATGKDFPDALSGSGLAAKFNSPILFVGEPLSQDVNQYLADNKGKSPKIYLLGGEGAISKNVQDAVDQIFE